MVKIVKFSCHGFHAPAYGCSLPGDNSGEYVPHSDYAALQARHNALREAVALMLAALDSDKADAMARYFDARAEVDRLMGEGETYAD